MPRATCFAPCTFPVLCSSSPSRTSTTKAWPLSIRALASCGLMAGTEPLAAASKSFTELGIIISLVLLLSSGADQVTPFWRRWANGAMIMAPGCFAATLWRLTGNLVLESFKGPGTAGADGSNSGQSSGRIVGSPARRAAVRRYSFLRRVYGAVGDSVVAAGDAGGA